MPDESAKKEFAFEEEVPIASEASATPRYTLDELLAQCGTNEPLSEEDRAWIDFPSVVMELL
jgi:antitoxin ChpS